MEANISYSPTTVSMPMSTSKSHTSPFDSPVTEQAVPGMLLSLLEKGLWMKHLLEHLIQNEQGDPSKQSLLKCEEPQTLLQSHLIPSEQHNHINSFTPQIFKVNEQTGEKCCIFKQNDQESRGSILGASFH